MIHLKLLLYFTSLLFGTVAIFNTLFLYRRYKEPVMLSYSLCLLSGFLIALGSNYSLYLEINNLNNIDYLHLINTIIHKLGFIIMIYNIPLLTNFMLGLKLSFLKKILFSAFTLIFIIIVAIKSILINFGYKITFLEKLLEFQIYAVYIYMLIAGIINYKKLNNHVFKKIILIFFISTLIFFPFMLPFHKYVELVYITYFLTISMITIILSFIYYDNFFFYENNNFTDIFRKSYNLTNREIEIIENMMKGLSNKELSNILYISPKTVQNHITNIYQKINVQNRIQLFNLISANQKK